MKTVTTEKVIGSLTKMFATHGLPILTRSHHGPQFVSAAFRRYVVQYPMVLNIAMLLPCSHKRMERLSDKIVCC